MTFVEALTAHPLPWRAEPGVPGCIVDARGGIVARRAAHDVRDFIIATVNAHGTDMALAQARASEYDPAKS